MLTNTVSATYTTSAGFSGIREEHVVNLEYFRESGLDTAPIRLLPRRGRASQSPSWEREPACTPRPSSGSCGPGVTRVRRAAACCAPFSSPDYRPSHGS